MIFHTKTNATEIFPELLIPDKILDVCYVNFEVKHEVRVCVHSMHVAYKAVPHFSKSRDQFFMPVDRTALQSAPKIDQSGLEQP